MKYNYVRRMNSKTREQVDEMLVSLNEVATNDADEGETVTYTLGKCSDAYTVIWTHTNAYGETSTEAGSIVRCKACGFIRELFDGQIEWCPNCEF